MSLESNSSKGLPAVLAIFKYTPWKLIVDTSRWHSALGSGQPEEDINKSTGAISSLTTGVFLKVKNGRFKYSSYPPKIT